MLINRKDGSSVTVKISRCDAARVALAGPWHVVDGRYIARNVGHTTELLHHFIIGRHPYKHVDHIDGDGFNNTRENLRFVTREEQNHNRCTLIGRSGFRGVHWRRDTGTWRAYVTFRYRRYCLGSFRNKEDAARAAARKRRMLFSHVNEDRIGGFQEKG